MTILTSSTGVSRDVDLDIDRICEYEESHPGWTIADLSDQLDRLSFTAYNLMAQFLGFKDYKDWIDEGFTMEQMGEAIQGSKYLGFTASEPTGGSES